MCTTIERIECVGPDGRARRIFFDDGSARTTSAAAMKAIRLGVGDAVAYSAVDASLAEIEPELIRARALQLLGYRERSVHELSERLLANGYPAEAVSSVVERYAQVGLVDDHRFALAWVGARSRAGYGRRRIMRELAEKGVSEEHILAALSEALEHDEVARATAALRGRGARDAKDRERLIRRLVARGFEYRVAIQSVDAVTSGDASDADA